MDTFIQQTNPQAGAIWRTDHPASAGLVLAYVSPKFAPVRHELFTSVSGFKIRASGTPSTPTIIRTKHGLAHSSGGGMTLITAGISEAFLNTKPISVIWAGKINDNSGRDFINRNTTNYFGLLSGSAALQFGIQSPGTDNSAESQTASELSGSATLIEQNSFVAGATWDGTTSMAGVRFFINGRFLSTATNTNGSGITSNSAQDVIIGAGGSPVPACAVCYVWNKQLPDGLMRALTIDPYSLLVPKRLSFRSYWIMGIPTQEDITMDKWYRETNVPRNRQIKIVSYKTTRL